MQCKPFMAIFSILFLLSTYLQHRGLEDTVRAVSFPTQQICKDLYQFPSIHLQFYRAVSCGTPIKDSSYDVLKIVSLWHLIIVSAGHFNVLLWILKRVLPFQRFFAPFFLTLFSLWTGAQPPIMRALFDYFLKKFSQSYKLWIPSAYVLLYSSSFLLLIFPTWSYSWSFLLSWLCTILVLLFSNYNLFIQSLGIFIGVFPVIVAFSTPHPLSFLFNFILGPPLAVILFPFCLLMFPFPKLHFVIDPMLTNLILLLNKLINNQTMPQIKFNPSTSYLLFCWVYLFCLQLILIIKHRRKF